MAALALAFISLLPKTFTSGLGSLLMICVLVFVTLWMPFYLMRHDQSLHQSQFFNVKARAGSQGPVVLGSMWWELLLESLPLPPLPPLPSLQALPALRSRRVFSTLFHPGAQAIGMVKFVQTSRLQPTLGSEMWPEVSLGSWATAQTVL